MRTPLPYLHGLSKHPHHLHILLCFNGYNISYKGEIRVYYIRCVANKYINGWQPTDIRNLTVTIQFDPNQLSYAELTRTPPTT